MQQGREHIQWVIKSHNGEELGPYSTEIVIKLITEGGLTGDEKIKKYPHGKWIEISKEAQFYDSLLSVLEESVQSSRQKKNRSESSRLPQIEVMQTDQETQYIPSPLPPRKEDSPKEIPVAPSPILVPEPQEETVIVRPNTQTGTPAAQAVLEIPKAQDTPEDRTKLYKMLGIVVALFAVVGIALFLPDSNANRKPHLLVPRAASGAKMSPEESKQSMRKIVAAFLMDSYEHYQTAQSLLVSFLEKDSSNTEARGLLCLVYRELWPFVVQDSADLEAVNAITRSTRSLDPVGINGIYCEASRMMVLGKFKEAKGILDHSLNQPSLSSAPILYALKAEILSSDREMATAALYAEKAKKLWPDWAKPQYDFAYNLMLSNQGSSAFAAFHEVLVINPKHKKTLIAQGILQFRSFQQSEQAYTQLTAALKMSELVPRPLEAQGYLVLSEIALQKKDTRHALDFAMKAYELNPGDGATKDMLARLGGAKALTPKSSQTGELVYLGDQYFRSGDYLAAQAEYKAAYELEPANAVAAMKAAKCLWLLNQSQEALSWLNKAIVSDRKLLSAYVLLADYQSQKYNYSAAIQALNNASKQNANQYEVIRGYGMVEYRRNNLKEASVFLLRSFKAYENDVETLILLAKTYGGLRDYREASKYAVRAIEVDSTNNDAQITYAKVLAQLNGVDAGISYLKSLIAKFSYTHEFYLGLAELQAESERFRISQDLYNQVIMADARNKKAYLGYGESLRSQGLYDQALKAFLDAAILDPTDVEGVFRAGMVYLEKEKYSEAIKQFQRALKINPYYPRLNYYIGKAYFLNGDFQFALQAANEERKMNPNLADSYLLAAEVYTVTKQFSKCAEEYQQAIRLRPQGAELYVKLARCYRQGGNADVAENMLNIAANQESGMPEIYREQGQIYENRGDAKSAVSAYNKYLTLSPNAPDRVDVEKRISKLSSGN